MTLICSNCNKIFEHSGKYCSEQCAREVHTFWRQFSLALVAGMLAATFANYTVTSDSLLAGSCRHLPASGLYEFTTGGSCAICMAKIKSLAKSELPEKLFSWAPASLAANLVQKVGAYVGLAAPADKEKS